jgi:hypothetical protein
MKIDVIPLSQNFRGMSYGQWATVWDKWLMSDDPDSSIRKDILFLRGNIDYKSVGFGHKSPRFMHHSSILDRSGKYGESIFSNTAIFIPVLTSRYSLGDIYDGRRITDEVGLRDAVNRDTDESLNMWAIITDLKNLKSSNIVDDLHEYRLESPAYKLSIASRARLRKRTESSTRPGIYDSIVAGFFLLVRRLPVGRYRLRFGGEGRGKYCTDSIYDVSVKGVRKSIASDTSSRLITTS